MTRSLTVSPAGILTTSYSPCSRNALDKFGKPNRNQYARKVRAVRQRPVNSSEMPINSDVSRHVNQRMFTIGCGQPLAKRWLDHEQCACARFGVLMDGGEVTGMRVGSR